MAVNFSIIKLNEYRSLNNKSVAAPDIGYEELEIQVAEENEKSQDW